MKAIVVYKSKTGFARKYAEWISEETGADIFDASEDEITVENLKAYDAVIYGGGVYAAGINGINGFLRHLPVLNGKKVAVFAVGVSPPGDRVTAKLLDTNFNAQQQETLRFFYFRGGFNFHKLLFFDKVMMSLMKFSIQWKAKRGKDLTSEEKGMLKVLAEPADFTDREQARELVDFVKV